MIVLDATTKKLELVLGAAHTTTALSVSTFYYDSIRSSIQEYTEFLGGSTHIASNGTTPVTIIAAPVNGVVRNVKHIAICNKDTVDQTVTVNLDFSATDYSLVKVTLEPNQNLLYDQHNGWRILPEPCCEATGGGAVVIGDITMNTNRLLGRTTASAGDVEEITVTANNGLLLATQALSIDRAVQSDMETPTSGNKIVASTIMLYHPGVAKAWCSFDATGSLLGPSYNIGSVTDNGTGDWTVNISGSFPLSSANGTIQVTADDATPAIAQCVSRVSASAYQIKCWDITGTLVDPDRINFTIFGDCS